MQTELEILRDALLSIASNRVAGRPTLSAGTAMIALAKARSLSEPPLPRLALPEPSAQAGRGVSFIRLPL